MSKSINDDITSTLNKLTILLEYSTSSRSEDIAPLITRAKVIWEEGEENGTEDEPSYTE